MPAYAEAGIVMQEKKLRVNMYDKNRLSVVVPTYCEASNLPLLVEKKICSSFQITASKIMKLWFVDDNSPDNTIEVCRSLSSQHPELKLITRTDEEGLGNSHKKGD